MTRRLTERHYEVLAALEYANHGSRYSMSWARPLDLGAGSRSHHSNTLAVLANRGLVEFKQRGVSDDLIGKGPDRRIGCGSRGSKEYRITAAGRAALKEKNGARNV